LTGCADAELATMAANTPIASEIVLMKLTPLFYGVNPNSCYSQIRDAQLKAALKLLSTSSSEFFGQRSDFATNIPIAQPKLPDLGVKPGRLQRVLNIGRTAKRGTKSSFTNAAMLA
jgi:hypothetical protein